MSYGRHFEAAALHGRGPFVCAAAMLWLRSLAPGFDYWRDLLAAAVLFSRGLSLIVAPLTATVLADAGPGDAGIASGVNNAVARVAGLLGIAVVGAAIAGAANRLELSGFRLAMTITAGLVAVGGVVGGRIATWRGSGTSSAGARVSRSPHAQARGGDG